MPTIHLTKRTIEAIPLCPSGQILYRDTKMRGFGLRVGSSSKVFFAEGQVAARTVRCTIGPAGPLSPEVARGLALQKLSAMAQGRDPNADKRQSARRGITLADAFEQFFVARPNLAAGTLQGYGRTVRLYLQDWASRPLSEVSRTMVLARHRELKQGRGAYTANAVMRHLRSVYNATAASEEGMPPNPVEVLTQARSWVPEKRRTRLITASALPAWWSAVMVEQPLARDYLIMALLTGMRRREIAGLRWADIDLKARTLTVPKTKNGDQLQLPLSSYLHGILMRRKLLVGASPFIFPTRSASGHLEEVKSFCLRVSKRSGIEFSIHDLRRTFVTIAESLDIPAYTLKRLLNHRGSQDVTGGYIIIDVERLRAPVQLVATRLLAMAEDQQNGMGSSQLATDAEKLGNPEPRYSAI